jgi:hypothetical protein
LHRAALNEQFGAVIRDKLRSESHEA